MSSPVVSFEKLKAFRKANKLTQEEMGDILGVKRTAYAAYETGRVTFSIELLQKLATHFGTSLDQMVKDINNAGKKEKAPRFTDNIVHEPEVQYGLTEKYYRLLEENNQLLREKATTLQSLVDKVSKCLAEISEDQLSIAEAQGKVNDELLKFVALQTGLDVQQYLVDVYNKDASAHPVSKRQSTGLPEGTPHSGNIL